MSNVFIDEDFVAVYSQPKKDARRRVTLAFGDEIEVLEKQGKWTKIRVFNYFDQTFQGWVKGEPRVRETGVLRFSMLDVQQGDGMVLETPGGKVVFIDGGDNKLFARHVAARYRDRHTSSQNPLDVDAIIVTHGDADHFDGLNEIRRSETYKGAKKRKSLFIRPRRVFHNGLVKGPSKVSGKSVSDVKRFGRTVKKGETTYAVDLYDDPREAPASKQNRPFKAWAASLDRWEKHGPIEFRRVAHGMDANEIFDFLHDEGITIEIQGPFTSEVTAANGMKVDGLPFLHRPAKSALMHLEAGDTGTGLSASHTINGHSIALRLTYKNVRFNLTGDLNAEAMNLMKNKIGESELEAEIVKAPHHGSHDFDFWALKKMRPVAAIISSGDEMVSKEHIHPRATLMSALGKVMRHETGVVFCTELAAFFAIKDYCYTRDDLAKYFKKRKDRSFTGEELRKLFSGVPKDEDPEGMFFGFERTNFGVIHVRTDGKRVLIYTHSGKKHHNEAYRFEVTKTHKAKFSRNLEMR